MRITRYEIAGWGCSECGGENRALWHIEAHQTQDREWAEERDEMWLCAECLHLAAARFLNEWYVSQSPYESTALTP